MGHRKYSHEDRKAGRDGSWAESHVRAYFAAELTKLQSGGPRHRVEGRHAGILGTMIPMFLKQLGAGCSPWYAAHMGLLFGTWGTEDELWAKAVAGHRSIEGGRKGGRATASTLRTGNSTARKIGPDKLGQAIVAEWKRRQEAHPDLENGALDRDTGAHFGLGPRAVRIYRNKAGLVRGYKMGRKKPAGVDRRVRKKP